jgi:hypothetical protein
VDDVAFCPVPEPTNVDRGGQTNIWYHDPYMV